MRYLGIDTVSFTDINGNDFPVKDIREFQTLQIGVQIKSETGVQLDEVMSRKDIYGNDAEDLAFALFDANRVKITESDFILSKIKRLDVPVIETL